VPQTHLLTTVLQISHEVFLHPIELRELYADGLSGAFKVLSALREVLAALDSSRGDSKRSLFTDQRRRPLGQPSNGGVTNLELLVDALQAINGCVQASDFVGLELQLLLEILDLVLVSLPLRGVLGLQLVLRGVSVSISPRATPLYLEITHRFREIDVARLLVMYGFLCESRASQR